MGNTDTPESGANAVTETLTLEQLSELATVAASHPAVAPPLRELVPALVALVRSQAEFIASFQG
ncbi:hypothetical protein ACQ86G_21470 [Roseateles chitinivorans]|uniref:hypothetical protein n=1 Tax=Roseateles chitinivorans TaxID=2917965 RepID=UPI003D6776B2